MGTCTQDLPHRPQSPNRENDGDFFGEVYTQYSRKVQGYLSQKTGNLTVAEDLSHDVFVSLMEKNASRYREDIERYLMRTARNKFYDYLRRKKYRNHLSLEEELDSAHVVPCSISEKISLRLDLDRSFSLLPEKKRTCLRLKLDGFSHKEIAAQTGATESAVNNLIARARGDVKRMLGQHD